jgi:hypothetical protein
VDGSADARPAPQIPIQGRRAEVAKNLSNLWVDYHLMAEAAAKGDSLTDAKTMEQALWAVIAQERIRKLGEKVLANQAPDTSNAAARFDRGELLAAKHILIGFGGQPQPGQPVPAAKRDSALRKAQALLPQVTVANFADLARKNSTDPGSAQQGGSLGVFPKGAMIPAFEKAVVGLKPGQLAPGLVETPYGFHIIYRPTFAEVTPQFTQALGQRTRQVAESTYIARLETSGKVETKGDAALWTKSIAGDVDGHMKDDKVLATSAAGDLKASRVAMWIQSLPGGPQLRQQIQGAPDSLVTTFVKQLARNELLLRQADSAKVQLDSTEVSNLRNAYLQAVTSIWNGLGVAPQALADSAKDAGAKARLASTRVEAYIDRLTQQKAPFVEVPAPISAALRTKYEYTVQRQGPRPRARARGARAQLGRLVEGRRPAAHRRAAAGAGAPGATPGGAAPGGAAPGAMAPGGAAPGTPPSQP